MVLAPSCVDLIECHLALLLQYPLTARLQWGIEVLTAQFAVTEGFCHHTAELSEREGFASSTSNPTCIGCAVVDAAEC